MTDGKGSIFRGPVTVNNLNMRIGLPQLIDMGGRQFIATCQQGAERLENRQVLICQLVEPRRSEPHDRDSASGYPLFQEMRLHQPLLRHYMQLTAIQQHSPYLESS